MEIRVALLLEGFPLPVDGFRLGNAVRLRRHTAPELRALAKAERFAQVEAHAVSVLDETCDYQGDPGDLRVFDQVREHLEEAALVLRLTFSGTIGWRVVRYSSPQQAGFPIFPCERCGNPNAWAEGCAVVTADGLRQAAALWQSAEPLLSARPWPRLGAALGRFTDSYSRRSPADKAVDLAIALEAAVGDPSHRGAKAHAVADRAAPLIAAELPSMSESEAYDAVLHLYSARNSIVHEAMAGPDVRQVLEWKGLVRAFLRQCLVRCAAGELPDWAQTN